MQIEQVKPKQPSFGVVVALFAVTILVIAVAAVVLLTWRSHNSKKPPFTRHPVSQLALPLARLEA